MKRLLLLRHAKSDWSDEDLADHDRPLNERGKEAAATIGRYLAAADEVPPVAVCSSALRARDTLRRAAGSGGWKCETRFDEALYGATPEALLATVHELDDAFASALLVGHEPTWSAFAGALAGRARLRFPTGALARIDLDVPSWGAVAFGSGTLIWLVHPRLLGRLV